MFVRSQHFPGSWGCNAVDSMFDFKVFKCYNNVTAITATALISTRKGYLTCKHIKHYVRSLLCRMGFS